MTNFAVGDSLIHRKCTKADVFSFLHLQAVASWIPAACFAIVGVGTIVAPVVERLNAPRGIVLTAGVVAAIGIGGASFAKSLGLLITLVREKN